MRRYAVYAIPGVANDDAPEAVRLRAAAEDWYARPEIQALTISARRYGFHATLKAPFRLAEGYTDEQLLAEAESFAAARTPVSIRSPRPRRLARFRALVPNGDSTAINSLAADAVREFDHFRAPLTADDRRRRQPELMTPRQRELFERWGYPYVLDEFRFHLTLTDPVPEDRSAEVDAALTEQFAGISGIDVRLMSIAVVVEHGPGAQFEVRSVHRFTGTSS